MKFAFIVKHRKIWPVAWLCEALDVSRSGFHAWLRRGPSLRAQQDDELTPKIRASFVASARTYGARRVWHDVLAEGASCGLAQDRAADAGKRSAGQASSARAAQRRLASGWPMSSRRMFWIASSRRSGLTRSGSPTSPISGQPRAGFMSRPSSTCFPAASSAGR